MAVIADAVFDAALNYVKSNVNKVQVVKSSSGVLVSKSSSVGSADFGAAGDYASGGREIDCLTGSDFQSLAVSTGGNAAKVRLLKSSVVVAVASIASAPIALGSSDKVNIGSFAIILKDPT